MNLIRWEMYNHAIPRFDSHVLARAFLRVDARTKDGESAVTAVFANLDVNHSGVSRTAVVVKVVVMRFVHLRDQQR